MVSPSVSQSPSTKIQLQPSQWNGARSCLGPLGTMKTPANLQRQMPTTQEAHPANTSAAMPIRSLQPQQGYVVLCDDATVRAAPSIPLPFMEDPSPRQEPPVPKLLPRPTLVSPSALLNATPIWGYSTTTSTMMQSSKMNRAPRNHQRNGIHYSPTTEFTAPLLPETSINESEQLAPKPSSQSFRALWANE